MVGLGRSSGFALLALVLGACGSAGITPKAFEPPAVTPATPSYDVSDASAEPVVITTEVAEAWGFLYRFITETEFVLCLEGSKQDGKIIVDGWRLARMEATSVNSVRYQPCNSPRYVGTAHNHPPVGDTAKSLCYQSEPDRRSFSLDTRAMVDIVLCGDDRFLWVLKDGRSAAKTSQLLAKSR